MLLLDLEANKSSLEYYRGLVQCGGVPVNEAGHVAARIKYLTHIIIFSITGQ